MPFQCPGCSSPRTLTITAKLEIPADARSDEISLQVVQCRNCCFAGLAIYEESRRGSLDSDSFNHTGYRVHADDLKSLEEMIQRCPQPKNPRCNCLTHRKLGKKNAYGNWDGLGNTRLGLSFLMKLR